MKPILTLLMLGAALSANAQTTLSVEVKNPLNQPRTEFVVIPLAGYGDVRSADVLLPQTVDGNFAGNVEVACQLDDLDQDERFDELCFEVHLDEKETKRYTVKLFDKGTPRQFEPKVYTEMLMRKDRKSVV